jgi:hypothetical protein
MGILTLNRDTLDNNTAQGGASGVQGLGDGGGGIGQSAPNDIVNINSWTGVDRTGGGFGGPAPGAQGGFGGFGKTGGGGGGGFGSGANGGSNFGLADAVGQPGGGLGDFGGAGGSSGAQSGDRQIPGGAAGDGGGGGAATNANAPGTGAGYSGLFTYGGNFGQGGGYSVQTIGGSYQDSALGAGVGSGGGVGGGGGAGGVDELNQGFLNGELYFGSGGGGGFGGGGGYGFTGGNGGFGGGGGNGLGSGGFGGGAAIIYGGGGAGMGGAVFNLFGNAFLTNSTIAFNSAAGGVAFDTNGSPFASGSGYGGGVFNVDGFVNLADDTVAFNSVSGYTSDGGAVYNLGSGNDPASGRPTGGYVNLDNNILSNSSGGKDLASFVDFSFPNDYATVTASTNLIQTSSVPVNGVVYSADPSLGRLQNNGGPTPTLAITPLSPAYGVGDPTVPGTPSTDQRLFNRLDNGRLDLGAYEAYDATVSVVSVAVPFSTNPQLVGLTAYVYDQGNPVNEGTIIFTVDGLSATANVLNGQASTTLALPPNFAEGQYTIGASLSDPFGPYQGSGSGTLFVGPVFTTTTVSAFGTPAYSAFPQQMTFVATVTNPLAGAIPNEGFVTFDVTAGPPNSGGPSVGTIIAATDSIGNAVATFTLPPNLPAGDYTVTATYTDAAVDPNGQPNFLSSTGTTAFTVAGEATQVAVAGVETAFNPNAGQTVNLSATVTTLNVEPNDPSGAPAVVPEGTVTFEILGLDPVGQVAFDSGPLPAAPVNSQGVATLAYQLPAGFAAGPYIIEATYSDTQNSDGGVNFLSSFNTGGLQVDALDTQTQVFDAHLAYDPVKADLATLTAHVSSNGQPVTEGVVTFLAEGLVIQGVVDANGNAAAAFRIPAGTPAGTVFPAKAFYDDQPNILGLTDYNSSSGTASVIVDSAAVQIQVSDFPNAVNFGGASTLVQAVVTSNGLPVNEGVITFSAPGQNPVNAAVFNGRAVVNFPLAATTPTGTLNLTAAYADVLNQLGQPNYQAGSGTTTLTVQPVSTSVSLGPVPAVAFSAGQQSVKLTAQATNPAGVPVSTGSITFTVAGIGSTFGSVDANGNVTASLNVPGGIAPGNYSLTASYADVLNANGQVNFTPSSTTGTLVIQPAAPLVNVANVGLTFSPTKKQTATLTATLTNAGLPVPEGTVTFVVSAPTPGGPAVVLGQVQGQVNRQGIASAPLTVAAGSPGGTYTIAASFADTPGSGNYTSSSGSGTLTISPAATATTLKALPTLMYNSAAQTLQLTAAVTGPAGGVTTGSVTFTVGALTPVTGQLNAQGVATAKLTIPAGTAAGSYAVSAVYTDQTDAIGGTNLATSSASGTLNIQSAATKVTASGSATYSATADQQVTLTAAVKSPGGTVPGGTVTFIYGNQTVQGQVSNGVASAPITVTAGTAAGTYSFSVSYGGTGNFAASSGSGTLTVNPARALLSVPTVSVPYSNTTGQQVTVSATVTTTGNSPVSEGNVTFTYGNQSVTGRVNSKGVATGVFSVPAGTAVGVYKVLASYTDTTNANGVVNYRPATATGFIQVTKAASAVQLSGAIVSGNGSKTAETFTAQVSAPGNAIPAGGQVTFTLGSQHVTATVDASGRAVATLLLPAGSLPGTQTVSVAYADPTGNFQSSSAKQTFGLAPASSVFPVPIGPAPDGSRFLEADFFGLPLGFLYDQQGRLSGFTYGAFQGALTYDSNGRLQQVTIDGVQVLPLG